MFGKVHPVRYAGKFEFGLKDVGKFPPKPRSIFHDKEKLAQGQDGENDKSDGKQENEEEGGNDDDSSAFSPSIAAITEVRSPKIQYKNGSPPKTETKRVGRIQFEGIVIPPSAPKDLICEECEKKTASLFCSACEEVFCVDCADIAHPRVSQNDLMHQHEKDGKIRALRVGDKSRVKNDTTTFFLPDEELQIEDYMKLKDLTKPNSLSTGSDAKKFKPSLQKRSTPQFKVNQMVLFKDPVSGRDAYGQVMSEWDQRHGTGVTPAILRGEDSLVYYIVQQHGLLVDVEHLVDLVPGLEEKMGGGSKRATATDSHNPRHSSTHTADADQEEETETVISDATHSTLLVKGTDKNIPLRKEYEIALSVNKRLKDLKNILTLGPKYHLRDLRDPKNIMAKQLHPEAFGDDTYSHGTIDQSMAMSTLPGPGPGPGTTSISAMPSLGHPASGLLQLHPTSPNSITKRNGHGHGGESIAAASRFQEITSPGKVSIAGDRSVLTYKPRLPVLQQYYADSLQQEAAEKRTNEEAAAAGSSEAPYTNVDLNLYANIDGDAQTLLSYYNPHYKPLPAPQRSYEDLLRSQLLFPIDKSAQKDLLAAEEADHHHHHHAVFYHTDRYSDGRREAPAWTSFLVVGEQDLQSLHAYIEDIERRKRQLLTRIFHRQDYLFMKIQLHRKFRYWKNNLKAIWVQRQHICATKIQTRARVWLCRYKLSDLREYWAQVYEERRLAVHAQFRFSRRGDPYAVTYDNKKFFATHADMNRYCRFLALMLSRIVRFMNRKRLRLMGKTIVVWKSAIYDFVESTLQNEHIDLALVDFDRRQHGVFSLEQEKEKMIETFQMLMQSLPHGTAQQQQQQLLWYDNRQHNTVSSWPLRIEPPLSFFDTHRAAQAAAVAAVEKAALQQRYEDTVPPYDPATMMPFLPELPRVQRPQTFKERLQQDVAAAAKTAAAFDPHEALVEGRIPMAGAVSYAYWMLPNVVMVGDAPFGPAHTNSWKLVPTYEFYAEKRIYHHEPFPMELQYPYESGCNGFLRDEDIDLVGGVTMIRRNKLRAMQRQQEALTQKSSTNALAKPPRQKEILSAITQLLMSGVDTFISLLSEEEETRVEGYYKALPLPALIDEAMEKAQLTANRIIVDNQDIIHKQEAHLEKIPHYGKTDPRYPQAFREKLRCQARIALAESNIVRIRKQVKNIPTNGIKFHRLPVMQHAYPWTVDHVLPSLWQLEKIIAETMARYDPASQSHGKIYFYGGGLACDEDGPARDGRAGLFMSMVLGRLYHIEPQEALYRWQKAHDCMPALKHMKLTATSSSTTYLTNCPPLPWQKNLLFDVLRRSHLPLDYPTIRIQLEPDRFQDLHRNHYDESLRYQVGVIEAALDAQEGNNKGKRPASPPPFKVPGIKVRSNAGVVKPTDVTQEKDEADKGYSVAYEEAERQEAILRSGTERMKQSAYFHQELVWPPVDPNVHQAGMGPDLSRKHRSAIVVTPTSSKSTRESRREAESRKLQRRAAKKEARSLKIQELSSQREEMSDHDTMGSDDDSVGSFSCFSGSFDREEERDIVLMPVVLPHNASLAEGVHPSTLMHHHILSPMKELVNEDDG